GRERLQPLLPGFGRADQFAESRRVDRSRRYRIDANAMRFQVGRPGARERAHRGFGRAIDNISGSAFCTVNRTPFTLTPKVASYSSSVMSPSAAYFAMPALAKTILSLPLSCLIVA